MKTTDANYGNTPELTNEEYFEERKLLLAARQRGYQRADLAYDGVGRRGYRSLGELVLHDHPVTGARYCEA